MTRVIAIFGASGVGKTTVAKELARTLSTTVRHCGELVKAKGRALGISSRELPISEHRKVDEDTRSTALNAKDAVIIEGRFLDRVLSDLPNVMLCHLTASAAIVSKRKNPKSQSQDPFKEAEIQKEEPSWLKERTPRSADLTINTDVLTATQVAEKIVLMLNQGRL